MGCADLITNLLLQSLILNFDDYISFFFAMLQLLFLISFLFLYFTNSIRQFFQTFCSSYRYSHIPTATSAIATILVAGLLVHASTSYLILNLFIVTHKQRAQLTRQA